MLKCARIRSARQTERLILIATFAVRYVRDFCRRSKRTPWDSILYKQLCKDAQWLEGAVTFAVARPRLAGAVSS